MAIKKLHSLKFPGLDDTYTIPQESTEITHEDSTVGAELTSQSSQIANLEALGLTVVNGEINITFDAEGETA